MRYLKIFIVLLIGLLFITPDSEAAPGPGDGNILKRSVEETCHACHKTHLNAPNDPNSIKTHNSQIMESNKWTGGWGIAGGKYGEIVCTTCHTTHNTRNIYLIRESITVPNGTDTWPNGQSSISIDFRALSGSPGSPGLMGDDSGSHTTSTRVCQACHSRNKYHNYNSQWNSQNGGNLSHNNGSNCTECHKHTKGFTADFAATCGDCHGYPIKSNDVTPGSMGLVVSDVQYSVRGETGRRTQYGSTAKGAHEMHHNKGVSCFSCHYAGKTGAPPDPKFDGNVQIGFSINNNPIGGNYAAPAFPNTLYSIQATGTTSYTATGSRTCSNLYCHSDGGNYAGTISYKTINWGDTLATPTCNKCHGNQAGKYVITDRHLKHVDPPYNYACRECHSNTVDLNNNIIGSHVNNAKDVVWGSIAANSSNYSRPNCSNNYCHSKGPYTSTISFPSPNVTASWTSTFSDVCVSCHDGDASKANKMNSYAHLAHINDTANQVGRNINCTECHSATISTNTVISNYSLHVNRQLNIKFSGTWYRDADAPTYAGLSATGTAGAAKVPGTSNYTCSNVYCHSIGNLDSAGNIVPAGGVGFRNATWNGSAMNCAGCHGDGSTKSHPVYTSGTPGSNTANSHVRHVEGSSISCDYCHITTTTSTLIPPTTVLAGSAHLNRVEDVSMKTIGGRTGVYNTDKTCSSTYCHGSGASPAWGGTTNCASCHGANNNGNLSVGTTAGHAIHYNTTNLPTTMNDNDAHTANGYVYACKNCHPTTSHSTGPANANRDAEIGGTKISSANYTQGSIIATNPQGFKYTANGTCTTVCHTRDGVAGAPIVTPIWNAPKTTPNCGVCHNKAGDTSPVWTSAHTKHVNGGANNYSYTCNACHSTVASDNVTVTNRTLHVNASKEVSLNTWSGGTWNGSQCSNTYCHSAGTSFTTPTHAGVSWNVIVNCDSCHKTTGTGPDYANGSPKANSHVKHVQANNQTCDYCHVSMVNSSNQITNISLHVNKMYDVSMKTVGGVAGSYNHTTKVCSNVYCHSDGSGNYINPTWGNSFDGSCTGCHGFAPNTYAHLAHVQNASLLTKTYGSTEVVSNSTNYAFGCGNCHPVNSNKHADGFIDISLNPADGGTLKSKNSASWSTSGSGATRTCNGTYCHSNGAEGSNLVYRQVTWNEVFSINRCGKCHDNPPQYAGQSHYNPNNFMGKEGGHLIGIHFDNIYNGVNGLAMPGTTNTSSHGHAATSTTISCHICHNGIVSESTVDTYALYNLSASNMKCSNCHNSGTPTPLQNGAIANKSLHVNGIKNVVIATAYVVKSKAQLRDSSKPSMWTRNVGYKVAGAYDSATLNFTDWNPSTKTCTTACHNNIPIQWGSKAISCASCHNELP